MPAFQACSAAWQSGSSDALSYTPRPRERFITRMLYWLLSWIALCIAEMTTLSVLMPYWLKTRRLMRFTLGANTTKCLLYLDLPHLATLVPIYPEHYVPHPNP